MSLLVSGVDASDELGSENDEMINTSEIVRDDNVVETYTDLKTAIEAAQSGDTVRLTSNQVLDPLYSQESGTFVIPYVNIFADITIELNNFKISFDQSKCDSSIPYYPCIFTIYGSNVVIKGDGELNSYAKTNGSYGINIMGGGTLTIDGGRYYGSPSAIQVQSGSLTINDGTFDVSDDQYRPDQNRYAINVIDDSFKSGESIVRICGGTFYYDYSNNPEGTSTTYVAPGYKVVCNPDKSFVVQEVTADEAQASIDGNLLATLDDAIKYASYSGDKTKITLLPGLSTLTPVTIPNGKYISIDLNNLELSYSKASKYFITNNGQLEFTGSGTVTVSDSSYGLFFNSVTGELTIDSEGTLQFIGTSTEFMGTDGIIKSLGEMTIGNVTITSPCVCVYLDPGSTTTIDGANISKTGTQKSFYAVVATGELEINNDSERTRISSDNSGPIRIGDYGTESITTINGGVITGAQSIMSISCDSQVTINSGDFYGPSFALNGTQFSLNVNGGTFDFDVSSVDEVSYVTENHKCLQNDDGRYFVVSVYAISFNIDPSEAKASVTDGNSNMSVTNGGTLELINGNYTLTVSHDGYISQTVNFTVDGSNKTITVTLVKEVETSEDEESGSVTVTVTPTVDDEGTAVVRDDVVDEAIESLEVSANDKNVIINAEESSTVSISASSVGKISESGSSMTVSSLAGSMIISSDVAETISSVVEVETKLNFNIIYLESELVPPVQQQIVGDRPTYDISIMTEDGQTVTFLGRITLMLEPAAGTYDPEDVIVFFVDNDGGLEAMNTWVTNGQVFFETTHFCTFFVGDSGDLPAEGPSYDPGYDDEESLPPFIPQQHAEDDDTVLYIACCAAAAVVAILAIVIVMQERRR